MGKVISLNNGRRLQGAHVGAMRPCAAAAGQHKAAQGLSELSFPVASKAIISEGAEPL